jgi:hypothetical protein
MIGLFHQGQPGIIRIKETLIRIMNHQNHEVSTTVTRSFLLRLLAVIKFQNIIYGQILHTNEMVFEFNQYETTYETKWSGLIRQFLLVNEVSQDDEPT